MESSVDGVGRVKDWVGDSLIDIVIDSENDKDSVCERPANEKDGVEVMEIVMDSLAVLVFCICEKVPVSDIDSVTDDVTVFDWEGECESEIVSAAVLLNDLVTSVDSVYDSVADCKKDSECVAVR